MATMDENPRNLLANIKLVAAKVAEIEPSDVVVSLDEVPFLLLLLFLLLLALGLVSMSPLVEKGGESVSPGRPTALRTIMLHALMHIIIFKIIQQ